MMEVVVIVNGDITLEPDLEPDSSLLEIDEFPLEKEDSEAGADGIVVVVVVILAVVEEENTDSDIILYNALINLIGWPGASLVVSGIL